MSKLWSLLFLGGHVVGNGGDAVVCEAAGRPLAVEVLDFYEAREIRDWDITLPNDKPAAEIASEAVSGLVDLDPYRATLYKEAVAGFIGKAKFMKGTKFEDLPDSDHLPLPSGCRIEQIAIQREPDFLGDPVFFVNEDLWEHLDEQNRAGLILHEVIYWDALRHGHENSIYTRYVTGALAAGRLQAMTAEEYTTLAKAWRMDHFRSALDESVPWLLSHTTFPSSEEATRFCHENGMHPIDTPEITTNGSMLLGESYFGRYFLSKGEKIFVWLAGVGPRVATVTRHKITAESMDVPSRALCID